MCTFLGHKNYGNKQSSDKSLVEEVGWYRWPEGQRSIDFLGCHLPIVPYVCRQQEATRHATAEEAAAAGCPNTAKQFMKIHTLSEASKVEYRLEPADATILRYLFAGAFFVLEVWMGTSQAEKRSPRWPNFLMGIWKLLTMIEGADIKLELFTHRNWIHFIHRTVRGFS